MINRQQAVASGVLGLVLFAVLCVAAWAYLCDAGLQPEGPKLNPCYCQGQAGTWVWLYDQDRYRWLCTGYNPGLVYACGPGPCNVDERWEYKWEQWECQVFPSGPNCPNGRVAQIYGHYTSGHCCGEHPPGPSGADSVARPAWVAWLARVDCGCG